MRNIIKGDAMANYSNAINISQAKLASAYVESDPLTDDIHSHTCSFGYDGQM